MRQKFWMVLGLGTPNYKHWSKDTAKVEAERLAMANPGCEFTVLEAMATVVKSDLQWEQNNKTQAEQDPDDEVPF